MVNLGFVSKFINVDDAASSMKVGIETVLVGGASDDELKLAR